MSGVAIFEESGGCRESEATVEKLETFVSAPVRESLARAHGRASSRKAWI